VRAASARSTQCAQSAPCSSHPARYSSYAARTRCESAPCEQEFRYVVCAKIGNSPRMPAPSLEDATATSEAYAEGRAVAACDDPRVEVRPSTDADRLELARLFAVVAEERDGIATEPPVDVEERAREWRLDGDFVAVADGAIVGNIHVDRNRHGFGDIGMAVAKDWRGRGIGSALLACAIDWSREQGMHKLCLQVFAHNEAGIALYRKFGFEEEGRLVKQYRRRSGELWDAIQMGLLLED
jgi:RimJ/RimL family protein N-acetyltransferase